MYYICSTKNRGDGCSRHSIEENVLKELVLTTLCEYANRFLTQEKLLEQVRGQEVNFEAVMGVNGEILRLRQEQGKYDSFRSRLYEDLQKGVITKEEFERFQREFGQKAEGLERARKEQEKLIGELLQAGAALAGKLAVFKETLELKEIDRHTLTSMVERIQVFEGKRIEVKFSFYDQYRAMEECTAAICKKAAGKERSA